MPKAGFLGCALNEFNCHFYFLLFSTSQYACRETYRTPEVIDAFDAVADCLHYLASDESRHKFIGLSLLISPLNDHQWELISIAEGWRICGRATRETIERVLLERHLQYRPAFAEMIKNILTGQ